MGARSRACLGPSYDQLAEAAGRLGVRICHAHLRHDHGYWDPNKRTITLDQDLTGVELRAVLAHELTHAARGDHGQQCQEVEASIDRHVARLLVDPEVYRRAELENDSDLFGIAEQLDAPVWLVAAYQDWLG